MKIYRNLNLIDSTTTFIAVVLFSLANQFTTIAQYSSTQYQFNESAVMSGGEIDQTSSSYKSRNGVGESGIGNQTGTLFQANSGFVTTDEEYLDVNVSGGVWDLGYLSVLAPSTFSTNFDVRAYIAHGYSAMLVGPSPRLSSAPTIKQLTPLTSRGASVPGTEQYGVNLRTNTSPSIGASLEQLPDSSFSFGYVTADYNVQNEFKYLDGDVIARSDTSSGTTKYYMSFIANVSPNTPGGEYATSHTVVVLANY